MYVIKWHNESGDEGVIGYWRKRPTHNMIQKYLEEHFTEDYPDYFYWNWIELSALDED